MENTALWIFESYFLTILLGALMGLEREMKETRLAGLRTFILVTLFGGMCGHIQSATPGSWIIFAGVIAVTALSALAYIFRVRSETDVGLTTSIALLVAFGVGILVFLEQKAAAVALSFATTVILYFKIQMHEFTRKLSERDIRAIFQFGLVAFIILPLLPDRGYGPFQALNPYNIWLMVVLISAINLAGYVTMKFVRHRWSGPALGILGGVVSSTATTLSFSRHARDNSEFSMMGAVVVSLASVVVLFRIAFLVGIIHPELLVELVAPLGAMFLAGILPVIVLLQSTAKSEAPVPETSNPAEMRTALVFGLIYAVVLMAVAVGKLYFGDSGVYGVSFISGLTDVDAITLSNARLTLTGAFGKAQAAVSILVAYVANLAFKLAMVGFVGTRRMFRWTLLCFVCLALPALVVMI